MQYKECMELGHKCYQNGEATAAINYFKKALELARAYQHEASLWLRQTYRDMDEDKKAIGHYQCAVPSAQAGIHTTKKAKRTLCYEKNDRSPKALDGSYDMSQNIAKQHGSGLDETEACRGKGKNETIKHAFQSPRVV